MSDYMFMLDSHLNGEQGKVVAEVRAAAERANLNLFLTGGAMRDMLGGFPIRDLDFTAEGGTVEFAQELARHAGAEILEIDQARASVELRFPSNVKASISMAKREKYPSPGAKPDIEPATIHEDLRGRDFTVNAIALSLGKASRGLLLDPANGLGDLGHKELRAVTNYSLYDDPSRMLRMIRLRTRLGFTINERTISQYRNAREAKLETKIPPGRWEREFRQIALDPLAGDILKALSDEHLLELISPALSGAKLNLQGFQKLQKARQVLPFGLNLNANLYSLFLFLLFEKLTPKERTQFMHAINLPKEDWEAVAKLESKATKVEKELAAAKLHRPSAVYAILYKVPGEVLLFLLMRSSQRLVIDRVKNYFQKYLPAALEITEKHVIDGGAQPGTPNFEQLHQKLIAARLDTRPKRVMLEDTPAVPQPPSGRKAASLAR